MEVQAEVSEAVLIIDRGCLAGDDHDRDAFTEVSVLRFMTSEEEHL